MRRITGQDIIDFYQSRYDLLVLGADGDFAHLDMEDVEADQEEAGQQFIITGDGDQAQILLRRSDIDDGAWFPGALTADGELAPEAAEEMAQLVNTDGGLDIVIAVQGARDAATAWQVAADEANRLAGERALRVDDVVALFGGNQSQAGRTLGLDQAAVNRLVKKARAIRG